MVFEISPNIAAVPMKGHIQSQDKGIIWHGKTVATLHEAALHIHREDHIHVACGMNIEQAAGVADARYDSQEEDRLGAAIEARSGGLPEKRERSFRPRTQTASPLPDY
jgi:hypothetical protein